MSGSEICFRCPHCVGETVLPAAMAGRTVHCRYCGRELTVPAVNERKRTDADPSQLYGVDAVPQDVRFRAAIISTVQYTCTVCGARVAVGAGDIGMKKFCPDCGTSFSITQNWLRQELQKARDQREKSWTDPAARFHQDKNSKPVSEENVYGFAGANPPSASQDSVIPELAPRKSEHLVRVVCGLCGTIMYAPPSMIGKKLRCPDCETETEVTQNDAEITEETGSLIEPVFSGTYGLAEDPVPPVSPLPPVLEKNSGSASQPNLTREDRTLRALNDLEQDLSEENKPNSDWPFSDPVPKKKKRSSKRKRTSGQKSSSDEEPLNTEITDDGRVIYRHSPPPAYPMINRIFSPLWGVDAFSLSIFPFVFALLDLRAVQVLSASIGTAGAYNSFRLLAAIIEITLFSLLTFFSIARLFYGIFIAATYGSAQIRQVADLDWVSSLIAGLQLFLVLTIAALPGQLLAHFFISGDFPKTGALVILSSTIVSVLLFFPVFFLATMQYSVPFAPFSPEILTSFLTKPGTWCCFVLWTILIGVIPSTTILFFLPQGNLTWILCALAVCVLPSLYAAVLGRLAWVLREE